MDVEKSILIEYYYQITKASAVYVFTDGPAGGPAEDPPNPDVSGDVD
jgi:hypothetical protein